MPRVLLVPGIGGSTLSRTRGLAAGSVCWLNTPALLTSWTRYLRLAANGIDPADPPGETMAPGGPLTAYYGSALDYLRQFGWQVATVHQDWRQPLSRDVARVVERITRVDDGIPWVVLAHSRGGLVMRHVLAQLVQLGQLHRVERVISLGTPHSGSAAAAVSLSGWTEAILTLSRLAESVPIGPLGALTRERIRALLTTWPAIYELLPYPLAGWYAPGDPAALYRPSTWSAVGLTVSVDHLAAAETVWAQLPAIPAGVDWICVGGRGVMTPIGLADPARLADRWVWSMSLQGDGTVPLESALLPGRRSVIAPTEHSALAYDGRILSVVARALNVGLSADVVIDGPVLQA